MFNAVKVFSETKARERAVMGERITQWLQQESPEITQTEIRQSSDREFHCLSVVFFYKQKNP